MLKLVEQEGREQELGLILARQEFELDSPKEEKVKAIVRRVAAEGDRALLDYTEQFDGQKISANELKISPKEIESAYKKIDKNYLGALTKAIANITAYHQKQRPDEWFETLPHDVVLGQRLIPLERVGVYVPGGRAAYPSSVLMGAIPAKVAGVKEIYVVTPPPVKPEVLVAAAETGVTAVFQVGGAQAVAALAFGTKTLPRVDKIVGPGNSYVTLAKKIVYGQVGIDNLAGPSNVLIIADRDAEPEFMAADLLSQIEHDPESFAVMVTDSAKLAKAAIKEVEKQAKKLSRAEIIDKAAIWIFLVDELNEAVEICNRIAPEHLELQIGSPQKILEKIKNAGAVFLGPHSPVPVGDYIAGPNHVLPTGGTARFASPLGVYDFIKNQSIVGYTKPALKNVWKDIKLLAQIEGLDAHARAVEIRFS